MPKENIFISYTPEELKQLFRELLQEIPKPPQQKADIKYFTREDVSELLHISLPTLGDYVKHGVITAGRFGRRILFAEADVIEAVKKIPSLKFSRDIRR